MSHSIVVREKTSDGLEQFDLYSRLNKDRIIFIDTDVNSQMASLVVAQLLVLSQQDAEQKITMYINSPGGSVTDGLTIYDTMQMIANPIETICVGQCASMGAFLLSGGTKGLRKALPSSRIMIHQVSGGTQGTTEDNRIRFEEQDRLNRFLDERIGVHCGKKASVIKKTTERDCWFSAEEGKKFGIIDTVLYPTNKTAWK
jgi:ATP-dependent Clp protease protease subunit